jgi:ribonuclease-3
MVSQPFPPLAETVLALQAAIGCRLPNPALLETILSQVDAPLAPDAARERHRLQFLGDAAWNFAVARAALRAWPQADVGELTRLRARWSSSAGLAELARRLKLPIPNGPTGTVLSNRVWAETLEAILGAVLEDGGFESIQGLAERVIAEAAGNATSPSLDPKSALQMLCQARYGKLPSYRLLATRGPAHHPRFHVGVTIPGSDGDFHSEGEGDSRQAAEQAAAQVALERLGG